MQRCFDTHCHLSGKDLRDLAEPLLVNATEAGVFGLCLIASTIEDLEPTKDCHTLWTKKYPQLKIAYSAGLHPHEADTDTDEHWEKIEKLVREDANAIGETGLDFHYDLSDRDKQHEVFQKHIDLAIETQKPLVIHCRDCADEIIDQLKKSGITNKSQRPGILHCFAENQDVAKRCLDLGLMISFSGILSFKNAGSLREVAKTIPLDRLLIETDSPYLAPVPKRGRTNEPSFVRHTFDALSSIRQESASELSQALWDNSLKIFNLN